MIDIELPSLDHTYLTEIGEWLDSKIPNPPLPDEQRWTMGSSSCGVRFGIRFFNDADAVFFTLMWK